MHTFKVIYLTCSRVVPFVETTLRAASKYAAGTSKTRCGHSLKTLRGASETLPIKIKGKTAKIQSRDKNGGIGESKLMFVTQFVSRASGFNGVFSPFRRMITASFKNFVKLTSGGTIIYICHDFRSFDICFKNNCAYLPTFMQMIEQRKSGGILVAWTTCGSTKPKVASLTLAKVSKWGSIIKHFMHISFAEVLVDVFYWLINFAAYQGCCVLCAFAD